MKLKVHLLALALAMLSPNAGAADWETSNALLLRSR